MHKIIGSVALALLASSAHAAPASQESIVALLVETKVESLVDGMYGNVDQVMRQSIAAATHGKPVSEEQRRVLDAVPRSFPS